MKQNPEQTQIKPFHLITENGELQDGLSQHLAEYNYGKNYTIISIIGSQSSGKSTLLNKMFGTGFEVLNSSVERRQVTKGIWLASGIKSNLIVLDVEGSDSKERWDERHVFFYLVYESINSQFYEQSTALFALALSQILIINLWTHEVGRFSGSQYGILKVIFEMNIKLFGQDQLKQLVFILRDYSEVENFEEICDLIREDISRIWDEMTKPEQFKDKKPEQFFKIDFFKLSHMRYAIKEFNEGVDHLKEVFEEKTSPDYLLKNFDFESNLLLHDVPLYANQIWETIKSNKDLNLPSEKVVIANMRCNQIQEESLDLIALDLQQFKNTNKKKQIYHQFGNDAKLIISKALNYFDENSQSYTTEIKTSKHDELETQLIDTFYIEYQIQKKILHEILLTEYIQLVEMISVDKDMENFMLTLNETREKQIQQFQSALYKSQIKDNLWEIQQYVDEFKDVIEKQQNTFVDSFLNFFLQIKEKKLRKAIEKIINAEFYEMNSNFWSVIQLQCAEILKQHENNILQILEKSFKLNPEDSKEKLQKFKNDFTQMIETVLQRKCQDISFYVIKKFKNLFGRKKNGTPINWRTVELESIEPKYIKAKEGTLEVMNQFQFFELEIDQLTGQNIKQQAEKVRLIEEEEFKRKVQQLTEDMEVEYKEAIEIHNSKADSPIPKWMWALMIFSMYDEVFAWLTSSWCIFPTILTIIFIGVSFAIGQKSLPLNVAKTVWNFINQYFGSYLFKLGNLLGIN